MQLFGTSNSSWSQIDQDFLVQIKCKAHGSLLQNPFHQVKWSDSCNKYNYYQHTNIFGAEQSDFTSHSWICDFGMETLSAPIIENLKVLIIIITNFFNTSKGLDHQINSLLIVSIWRKLLSDKINHFFSLEFILSGAITQKFTIFLAESLFNKLHVFFLQAKLFKIFNACQTIWDISFITSQFSFFADTKAWARVAFNCFTGITITKVDIIVKTVLHTNIQCQKEDGSRYPIEENVAFSSPLYTWFC